MLKSKVQKWGNSQGLRLTKQVLERAEIAVGDDVEIVVRDHQIVVTKAVRTRPSLADLVSRIPPEMQIGEVDFGPPVGREVW